MHIAKYNRVQSGHILAHNEPTKARAQRDNVDSTLTKYNYSFVCGKASENLNKILSDKNLYVSPRKDLNVLCACIITAPINLPLEREKEFFYKAALFLQGRYGHCISAWVHKDEPNAKPHLHFDFVPIVPRKKGGYKVCAKEKITKKDLLTLHDDFAKYISKEMGLNLAIRNGATSNGNKTILELKIDSLNEEIIRLQQLKAQIQSEIERQICR